MQPCLGCTPVTVVRDIESQLGISRRQVQSLLRDGVLVRLDNYLVVGGCLAEAAESDPRLRHKLELDAVLRTYPECVASHESAAITHGLPLFTVPPFAIATRQWGAWRGGPNRRVRIAPLPGHHVCEIEGTPTTVLARTLVDLARCTTMLGAVVAGDAALRRGLPRHELWQMLDECARWSETKKAAAAIAFFDPRAESALESLSRVLMHQNDIPAPEPQYEVNIRGVTYRVDFYWKDQRLVGEADGKVKYSGALDPDTSAQEVVWQEKLREDALRDAGYQVVRWTYDQMMRETDRTIARIRRHLAG